MANYFLLSGWIVDEENGIYAASRVNTKRSRHD
jgi:hypothetical protein